MSIYNHFSKPCFLLVAKLIKDKFKGEDFDKTWALLKMTTMMSIYFEQLAINNLQEIS